MSLAILGQEDGSLPTFKVDNENWATLGYVWRFGESNGGPRGPRWSIYTPMAWMKWVEKKKWVSLVILGREDGSLI